MKKHIASVLCVLLVLALAPFAAASGGPPVRELTVLHVNDFHGRLVPFLEKSLDSATAIGGAAYLAEMIRRERDAGPQSTLLLSAGDMFQGMAISNVFKGRPVIEFMNAVGFEAMAVGNHEFDWGRDTLNNLIASAAFPFLAANVTDTDGTPLRGTRPYILLDKSGVKVAVIGITTVETPYSTNPTNVAGLVFRKPEKVLPGLIRKVRRQGAKLVIVLSHQGLDADKRLAGCVRGIDVIVGGHSHTAVTVPVKVRNTIIVQAGSYGMYLGVLRLKIDPATGRVLHAVGDDELRLVSAGPEDAYDRTVAASVNHYGELIRKEFSVVVGRTLTDLERSPDRESNVGDLIADAMRESTGVAVAFHNSGGIRANIPKGDIRVEQIYAVLPFDNALTVMDLTGRQIREILEFSAGSRKDVLQVSGLRVVYDSSRPAGSRAVRVTVGESPLDDLKTYRIVTNDFLAAGGDRFETFKHGKNIIFGDNLRDVLVEYLKKHSPVAPAVQDRTTFVNR